MQKTEENTLLITARTQACLTQKDVAIAMGVSSDTISRWELGKRSIPSRKKELFLQVCHYFDEPPAPPEPPARADGYDEEGYPIGWKHCQLKDFKNSGELAEYILSLLEGKEHKERKAFRREKRALRQPAVNEDSLRSRILQGLKKAYPEPVAFPALLASINATPAEREAATVLCTNLYLEDALRIQDNILTLFGATAQAAARAKVLEAADPGGVTRKAEAKAQADREHAERTARYEREEAEEAKRVEDELVQQRLREKRVEAKAALLLAQQEEEKRFREEQRKLREAQSNA